MGSGNFHDIFTHILSLLTQLIDHPDGLTLAELNDVWTHEKNYNREAHQRLMYRHRELIADIFGINIEVHKDHYRIANPRDIATNRQLQWSIQAFRMAHAVCRAHHLSHRILLQELHYPFEALTTILDAMTRRRALAVVYCKFDDTPRTHILRPYLIKQYRHLLYLLAETEHAGLRIYALDRISQATVLDLPFTLPATFDPERHFQHAFGVYIDYDRYPPQSVILRAHHCHHHYLLHDPLHPTQQIHATTTDHVDFSYYLSPTDDFLGQILQQADRLEVISPPALRQRVLHALHDALKRYV